MFVLSHAEAAALTSSQVAFTVLLETFYACISLAWVWETFVIGFGDVARITAVALLLLTLAAGTSTSLHRISWSTPFLPPVHICAHNHTHTQWL
jgi:hypothetical protein